MQESANAEFRSLIENELQALDLEDNASIEDRATVKLDQQSVGRLSRMDSMQRQALAQAQQRRRTARKQRLNAALARIEEGEFGYCEDCGDEIATARLKFDATVVTCIECAKDR